MPPPSGDSGLMDRSVFVAGRPRTAIMQNMRERIARGDRAAELTEAIEVCPAMPPIDGLGWLTGTTGHEGYRQRPGSQTCVLMRNFFVLFFSFFSYFLVSFPSPPRKREGNHDASRKPEGKKEQCAVPTNNERMPVSHAIHPYAIILRHPSPVRSTRPNPGHSAADGAATRRPAATTAATPARAAAAAAVAAVAAAAAACREAGGGRAPHCTDGSSSALPRPISPYRSDSQPPSPASKPS